MSGYQDNPYGGGGYGYVNDNGAYTGYGYDHAVLPSSWGWQDNYKPW